MIRFQIERRIVELGLGAETVEGLLQLAEHDGERVLQHPPIAALFAVLPELLHGESTVVVPFQTAWAVMYAAIGRLDSLQDGDPLPDIAAAIGSREAHYNLVFAAYVLATSLLDDLADVAPPTRVLRLQRLWSNAMLRMADGQQRDITCDVQSGTASSYQELAQAKTGATYALAFGGLAALLSDNAALITALLQAGEVFGTLIQYQDDLRDARTQPNPALTLPLFLQGLPLTSHHSAEQVEAAFWSYLLPIYRRAALAALNSYPEYQSVIETLFNRVFGRS